ncbi:MAG: D-aminoacyl-tRNA deacylase [Weeksellaceae bacterium]|nr:D-aminoacyl-tRNA deacylase [Weeksellaceae bacterium]
MRAVIQRVSSASVSTQGTLLGSIKQGLLIFLGVTHTDTAADADYLVQKISNLRIFADEEGVMNLSMQQTAAEALIISQFTLHAATKKGNRPSYIRAAPPPVAIPLYEYFVTQMQQKFPEKIATGQFGADMQVSLVNDGPVTIIIDSDQKDF